MWRGGIHLLVMLDFDFSMQWGGIHLLVAFNFDFSTWWGGIHPLVTLNCDCHIIRQRLQYHGQDNNKRAGIQGMPEISFIFIIQTWREGIHPLVMLDFHFWHDEEVYASLSRWISTFWCDEETYTPLLCWISISDMMSVCLIERSSFSFVFIFIFTHILCFTALVDTHHSSLAANCSVAPIANRGIFFHHHHSSTPLSLETQFL